MELTFIHVTTDNVDALLGAWRDELLPIGRAKSAELGWERSLVARGDGELLIVNVWADSDGLDRAYADPDINRVQDEILLPLASAPPTVRRMTVVEDLRLDDDLEPEAAPAV